MLRKWRSGVGLIFSLGLVLAIGGVASFGLGGGSVARADSPAFKVTLCHATDADNNPYTRNTVSFNSIADADDVNGHGDHTGPIWVAGDRAEKVKWGDIIPEYYYPTGVPGGSTYHYTGMNWTTEGQAIWNNACNIPKPTPPPTEKKAVVVSTTVFDATTKAVWAGTETAPASAYDTARVVPPSVFPVPTGTVTYIFYSSGNCVSANALGTDHSTVTLAAGVVPNSNSESNLGAGSYSFKAIYSGDGNYLGKASVCEPFSVTAVPPPTKTNVNVSTVVFDAATNKALIDLKLPAGGSVYDTSKVVAPSAIPAPTGTISYTFYENGTCAEDGTAVGTGLALGTNSSTKGPLEQGNYSFTATYSGDSHYNGKTSACEPFTVAPAQVTPTPSPTPTGSVEAATATPTGGVLAATGSTPLAELLALFLVGFGALAIMTAVVWRRRRVA